jgi:serine/threonine-protein kinase RsbT
VIGSVRDERATMEFELERQLALRDESDLVVVRRHVRDLAAQQGLSPVEMEALATAVTEIGRNAIIHGQGGEIRLSGNRRGGDASGRAGVVVTVRDGGAGIADIEAAMVDGFSTGVGLGLGLAGARRLVDVFELESAAGKGTTIRLEKWASASSAR